jgi:hypothetical protein
MTSETLSDTRYWETCAEAWSLTFGQWRVAKFSNAGDQLEIEDEIASLVHAIDAPFEDPNWISEKDAARIKTGNAYIIEFPPLPERKR